MVSLVEFLKCSGLFLSNIDTRVNRKHSGNINADINFEYGEGKQAHYGCGASLFGQFWYFGGSDETKRQVFTNISTF